MSRQEKLISRLLAVPRDFTWDELTKVLALFGYQETKSGKTGGSRRKFIDNNKNVISLHKPHPSNILKTYAIHLVIAQLKAEGHINKDE
jgi:hypothetical protein